MENMGSEATRPEVERRVVSSGSCFLASVPELGQEKFRAKLLSKQAFGGGKESVLKVGSGQVQASGCAGVKALLFFSVCTGCGALREFASNHLREAFYLWVGGVWGPVWF